MVHLGSAAAGAAGALEVADDHHVGKVERRRAASARRAPSQSHGKKDRSRSPGEGATEFVEEKSERCIVAPMYVEPGVTGDDLSAGARHLHNMQKIFGFLQVVEKVLNNHADVGDQLDFESRVAKGTVRDRSIEAKAMKSDLA